MSSNSEIINYIVNGGNDAEEAKNLVETDFDKFIFNTQFHKEFDIKFSVEKEFENIFDKYCKSSGKSDTQIGEILRGLMKLCYRYVNDGDEFEVGPYSGIWYGLKFELNCPFVAVDGGVEYWDYDYNNLNNVLAFAFGNDYIQNIALNALILETFEEYHGSNSVDIGNYYDYIVKFLVDKKILDKFEEHDINICHNFGNYGFRSYSPYSSADLEINSISEDMYITFSWNTIKIVYDFNMNARFNLEFSVNDIDDVLDEYGDMIKYFVDLSVRDYRKRGTIEEFQKNVDELGFEIKERQIVKKAA